MKTCLNFSGGKDSTAMLLRLIEIGERPDKVVFADTLMEYPEMYEFIDRVERHINQKIIRTKPNHTFLEWFFGEITKGKLKGRIRGFPYVVIPCWYQREAKVIPLEKENKGYTRLIGFCRGEEKRILKDDNFRYPLMEWRWDERKCLDYCKEKGMLNPLYSKFKRLGCWCCPKQRRSELMILKRDYPALWRILRQLEEISPNGFKHDYHTDRHNNQKVLFMSENTQKGTPGGKE